MRRATREKLDLAGGLLVWALVALAAISTILQLSEMF